MRRSIGHVLMSSIMRSQRAITTVGSMPDDTLRLWAQSYPAYGVRRVAFLEMARRERLEAA
jgi:hypothetical protein